MQHILPLFLLTTGTKGAAQDSCAPTPPVCHTKDNCSCTYCLGPAQRIANTPVRPYTCNGDWEITIAALYWKPYLDGLEFAIDDEVRIVGPFSSEAANNLINAKYLTPRSHRDFGFKLGVGYNTTCDGWTVDALWTRFQGNASRLVQAELNENHVLLPLWLSNTDVIGTLTQINAHWKADLDWIDMNLKRQYWVSPRMTFTPQVGLRYANIKQRYSLDHFGPVLPLSHSDNDMKQNFKGAGILAGFSTEFHFGCGFGIYGDLTSSIIYGQFDIDYNQQDRQAFAPFRKTKRLEASDHFRVSRAMLDAALGIEWFGLFCDCQYGIGVRLGYEQHLFFHMNQLIRVDLFAVQETSLALVALPSRENVYTQQTGTLSTRGWTLSVRFDF